MRLHPWFRLLALLLLLRVAVTAAPVEFVFTVPPDARDPFARELSAEVITPSKAVLRLPAFFAGEGRFAVRARATEPGVYRLQSVTEEGGAAVQFETAAAAREVAAAEALPPVRLGPDHAHFVFADGGIYLPLGANVAWAKGDPETFYPRALGEFQREGLNWMRVWMAHWSALNLDWRPQDSGPSPAPGSLDLRVAATWDQLIASAEVNRVYLQIVLQHHGQYSTGANPNWADNPWNAARPGGFLKAPGDFFTSPEARAFTARKYRYIIARWGYSPAVLAWELFNEVHWTDPIHAAHDERPVAQWHAEMAAFIRGHDVYRHLVTTSHDRLSSPSYANMDYFQPHLYAANILAGVRQFETGQAQLGRPVFYGEFGDDHMPLAREQKDSGVAIVPPVWMSLMGRGSNPAQPWLGAELLEKQRLGELGAVARFLAGTGWARREGLEVFSPALVDCTARGPLTLAGGHVWQRRPAPELTLSLDGREPVELAEIPRIYVGSAASRAEGLPSRATYHLDFAKAATVRARLVGVSPAGAAIRIALDGRLVAEKSWAARAADLPSVEKPGELAFAVEAGRHTLVVENPGTADWFDLAQLDLGLDTPVLAAAGQRNAEFVALWLWHRDGVFAVRPPKAASATLRLADLPAGSWRIVWWDTLKGVPSTPTTLQHAGGELRLPTPAIDRHAAVVLTREK